METLRVMIHAPTPEALNRAQSNVRNLLKLEPNAEVELVVNGPAVSKAVAISNEDLLSRLVLCKNSLDKQNLSAQPNAKVVLASVLYLANQQKEGWSYIRA